MHDGPTFTPGDVILRHRGQAAEVTRRNKGLFKSRRDQLLAFLGSLRRSLAERRTITGGPRDASAARVSFSADALTKIYTRRLSSDIATGLRHIKPNPQYRQRATRRREARTVWHFDHEQN